MKKGFKILAIILLCVGLVIAIYLIRNYHLSQVNMIIIEKNIPDLKTKHITERGDIEKVAEFVNKLKPLEDHEMINIVVTEDIVIRYKDKVTVILMADNEYICAYTLQNSQQTYLSRIPEGMYEWVMEKLK